MGRGSGSSPNAGHRHWRDLGREASLEPPYVMLMVNVMGWPHADGWRNRWRSFIKKRFSAIARRGHFNEAKISPGKWGICHPVSAEEGRNCRMMSALEQIMEWLVEILGEIITSPVFGQI